MIIKELEVKNFRSIVSAQLKLNNLSIFVGLNDVGKSNVLKALNLFFNQETEIGRPLNFGEDYCKYTPKRLKKAEEISMEILIEAPKNYKGSKDIIWKKTWRKQGYLKETISFTDGTNFPERTKLFAWLKNIRFLYVPAVRGSAYFESLLAELHDTLAETIENELRSAGDTFISKIKVETQALIKGIDSRLNLQSEIRLPPNLQALFKTLDFATTDGTFNISLSNRGDGIKTRHIPIILKFISNQLNINKTKGSPNINMIWGYEEPENNLEMAVAFELAQEFIDYSSEVQLLLTTHSPAFYSIKNSDSTTADVFKVEKLEGKAATIELIDGSTDIDQEMGLMPLVTPYILEKVKEIISLKDEISKNKQELEKYKKNTLFVEGDDETRIFTKLISVLGLQDKIDVSRESFGCSGVKQQLLSWSWLSGFSIIKVVGLFDLDYSGKAEKEKVESDAQYKNALQAGKVKAIQYQVPVHLLNIKQKIPTFPIELEEMYDPEVWQFCKDKNWLIKRGMNELNDFTKVDHENQSLKQKLDSFKFTENESLYIYFKIPDQHKDKVSKYLNGLHSDTFLKAINAIKLFFEAKVKSYLA